MSRSTARLIALAVLAALAVAGCSADRPAFTYAADPQPVVMTEDGVISVAQGTAVSVVPFLVHDDVEGSSELAIRDARSDDPTIARVASTTHDFAIADWQQEPAVVVLGVSPGTTMLRLFDDGTEKGTLRIDVVAQDP